MEEGVTMIYGNIGGAVHGQWKLKERQTVSGGAVSSVSFTVTESKKYKLIYRAIGDNISTSTGYGIQFNSDTSSNYGWQRIYGINTTNAASRNTSTTNIYVGTNYANGELCFGCIDIDVSLGKERVGNAIFSNGASSTTVKEIMKCTGSWDNTVDDLTTITFTGTVSSSIANDSDFILLELVDASDGTKYGDMTVKGSLEGCWERIATSSPTSGTSVTFSGLSGDTDVIYAVNLYSKSSAGGANVHRIRPNNDSGTNYGYQFLRGLSTTPSASRTTDSGLQHGYMNGSGYLTLASSLLYAKSGYERTQLVSMARDVTGTTVGESAIFGNVWSNTADEITSLVVTSGIAFASGTKIDLYRLNL